MKRLCFAALLALCAAGQAQRPPGLYAVFQTAAGTITARLYEKEVRSTVQNFVALAQGTKAWVDPEARRKVMRPLYNGITFHRTMRGVMIQAGDPTGTGRHNCGITLLDEFLPGLRFDRGGVLAMANSGNPDSGGCQFFITEGPMTQWNGKYTVFGQVVEGMDVVAKISRAPARDEKPLDPVRLASVVIERVGPEPGKRK
jgi:peptidyl-prolyl cis-trans isomerase A (cyclophilin A)